MRIDENEPQSGTSSGLAGGGANLRVRILRLKPAGGSVVYKIGYRDARHEAAEIAAGADARIKELEAVCRAVAIHYSCSLDHRPGYVRMALDAMATNEAENIPSKS